MSALSQTLNVVPRVAQAVNSTAQLPVVSALDPGAYVLGAQLDGQGMAQPVLVQNAAVATPGMVADAVAVKATRYDLGTRTMNYTAALALGAGAHSIEVDCPGAQLGDAIFVSPTAAVPDFYGIGAAQCLLAGKIRVSVVHPALVLGASFSIPLRVFALR